MFRNPLINTAKNLSSTLLRKKVVATPLYNLQQRQGKIIFMAPCLTSEDYNEIFKLRDQALEEIAQSQGLNEEPQNFDFFKSTGELTEEGEEDNSTGSPALDKAFEKLEAVFERNFERGFKHMVEQVDDSQDFCFKGERTFSISKSHYRKLQKNEKLKEAAMKRVQLAIKALENKGKVGDIPVPPPRPPRIVLLEEKAKGTTNTDLELLYSVARCKPPRPLQEVLEQRRTQRRLAKLQKTDPQVNLAR